MKISEMNPRTILEIGFTTDQLKKISKLFYDAAMLVNEIECEFNEVHQSNLHKYELLSPNKEEITLWTQLYGLQKIFDEASKIN